MTNSYQSLTTRIAYKGSNIEIELRRRVKQGDTLSPLIFNVLLDPTLDQLEAQQGCTTDAANSISCLAFAYLLLLADNGAKAQKMLSHTESYFRQLGMDIATSKCATLRIITTKDSCHLTDTKLRLSTGESIPSSAADTTLRYLEGYISLWFGLHHKDLLTKLQQTLDRLKKTYLKPHQKLSLLSTYLINHFLHFTVLAITLVSTVRNTDSMIRNHATGILHLPLSTPKGFMHSSKRDGGLGIPKLETLMTSTTLKQGLTLLNIIDPALQALFHQSKLQHKLEGLAKAARLNWPITNSNDLTFYKERQKWRN
jgi:hypothetical protein